MDNYYIYQHIRLDSDTPFYVGKGRKKRAYQKGKTIRNKYWNNIVNKYNYRVEIIVSDLTETEAFIKEMEFIKLYKSLGFCEANMTDGGEGSSGMVWSNDARRKISALHKRRVWSKETLEKRGQCISKARKGISMSEKQKKDISNTLIKKGAGRAIICVNTGITYRTAGVAARQLNINGGNISKVLNKKQETTGGYNFVYK